MGTKYTIEVEDKPFELLSEDGSTSEKLYRVKGFNSLVFDWNGLNMLTPYTEPDTEAICNEAYQKGYQDATVKISPDYHAIAEKAYQKGLNDAWSFAEHLAYISDDVTNSVYMSMNGGKGLLVAFGMSYEDAKKQYDEYFKKKKEEQIQVGDEMEWGGDMYVVTYIDSEYKTANMIRIKDGRVAEEVYYENCRKTGRHFHEIVAVLEKMRGE